MFLFNKTNRKFLMRAKHWNAGVRQLLNYLNVTQTEKSFSAYKCPHKLVCFDFNWIQNNFIPWYLFHVFLIVCLSSNLCKLLSIFRLINNTLLYILSYLYSYIATKTESEISWINFIISNNMQHVHMKGNFNIWGTCRLGQNKVSI